MIKAPVFLFALACAAPAFAGNIAPVVVEPAPVFVAPTPVYNWTGAYAGIQVGYGDIRPGGTIKLDDGSDISLGDLIDGDGAVYGLRLGYDRQLGRGLIGGMLQYDSTGIELGNGDFEDADVNDIFRAGIRAGAVFGRNLLYVAGGYASADIDSLGDVDGYFVGTGYEVFVTQNITLGAEALFHDFNDVDTGFSEDDLNIKASTFGVNVNYRF